jgi:hypothetical protein
MKISEYKIQLNLKFVHVCITRACACVCVCVCVCTRMHAHVNKTASSNHIFDMPFLPELNMNPQ